MCGIVGVVDGTGVTRHLEAVERASRALQHRGPDGEGLVVLDSRADPTAGPSHDGGDVALAHRRLSILDLSDAAAQPMQGPSGTTWLTYNGEIYNYLEVRRDLERAGVRFRTTGDTEVLLAAYEHWGESFLERLNGIFAFAVVDLRRRIVLIARDRLGVKPIYLLRNGPTFAFASEIKALLELGIVAPRLDRSTTWDFLFAGSLDAGSATFFEGVTQLTGGQRGVLSLDSGEWRVERWYDPDLRVRPVDRRSAVHECRELLADAVRLQMRSDVEVGSCLSGGLDSTTVVSLAGAEGKGARGGIQAFSSQFDDDAANELEYARLAARHTGARLHVTSPTAEQLHAQLDDLVHSMDEPFGSTSIFAQRSVFELARREGVKVTLDGQGADEVFGGYAGYYPMFLAELQAAHPWQARWERHRHDRFQRAPRGTPPAPPATPIAWIDAQLDAEGRAASTYLANTTWMPCGDSVIANTLAQHTLRNNLPQLLHFVDRNSMRFGVEARVPLLDHRLVEFGLRLPPELRFRNGYGKWVIRRAMAPQLPRRIVWRRRKLGFATPERAWQSGILRPMILGALHDGTLDGLVDPPGATRLFDELERTGRVDFAPFRWLSISLWRRRFGVS